jgi:hypothetical protein
MGVADDRRFYRLRLLRLFEQRFEPPYWSREKQRLDPPSHQLVR